MGRKLYVGNLPFSVNKQTLQDRFSQCGTVDSVNLNSNHDTGQCKGFAFIEMSSNDEAQKAIQELNGFSLEGREIKVNEAKALDGSILYQLIKANGSPLDQYVRNCIAGPRHMDQYTFYFL